MTRVEFSRKVRAAIIARAKGRCERCDAALKPGEGEVDHILPAALGGEASIANGRLLCRVCHREKTATDIRRTRKADRQKDKGTGAVRPKQAIKSRGFAQSERREAKGKRVLPPKRLFAPAASMENE